MGPTPFCVQTDTLRPTIPSMPTSILKGRPNSNPASTGGVLPSTVLFLTMGFNENDAQEGLVEAGFVKSPVSL
ncbi:hypothetical protein RRF57_007648 [Xylaria bambusicola]|uniref:UBA domain-containing protein n=1 Tax=Xylaria bambusicola TaxID=326684 RepID=A0AAN7UVM2_9PEZI